MRIRVAAGILLDAHGRVLLAERRNDAAFPNLWEFPGGKAEEGETAEGALCRELHEELGVTPTAWRRLVSFEHDYADRRIHLDFFVVSAWESEVTAMDGQSLKWVLPADVDRNEILPADIRVIDLLS